MRVLDLFSGIGGFALAFQRAGADHLAFCEQDKTCHRVLRRHFPGVPIINNVKEITKQKYPFQPDVICGGFPCQDVSVAGRRKGLAGERSGLWFEFIRIIAEYRPGLAIIENVPGLLSSNGGRDFATIIRGLVECGYGVAWRVLDSQYFGVPQRRNRVFIVGCLDAGRAAEILFEREGGGWHPAPSREAGKGIAATIRSGPAMRSAGAGQTANGMPDTAATLNSGGNAGGFRTEPGEHLIAIPIQEISKRTGKSTDDVRCGLGIGEDGDPMYTLQSGAQHGVTAFQINASDEVRTSDVGYTLNTNGNATGRNSPTIAGGFGVRRLMPVECERLQNFPDEWTRYGDDGGEISDSARYRMLGNAVTVSVAEWIVRRIFM